MNRPRGLNPSGGDPVPYPKSEGDEGEIGQTIFDKSCRHIFADPETNCKAVFGPEWEFSGRKDNYDPWGHTDDIEGKWHYFCPADSFFMNVNVLLIQKKKYT